MEIAVLDTLTNSVDIIEAPDNIEDIRTFLSDAGYKSDDIFFIVNDLTVPVCRYKAVKEDDGKYTLTANIREPRTSYEAYVKSKMHDYKPGYPKEQAFAATFLSEINHGLNEKEFAKALCHEHPTIQQMFFRLVRQCIRSRAEERPYSNDERNAGAVRMCQDLAKTIDKYPLPIK